MKTGFSLTFQEVAVGLLIMRTSELSMLDWCAV